MICDPHISTLDFVAEDALFLVIASDGLTEQWTVEGAAAAVLEFARDGCNPTEIAVRLSHRCVRALFTGVLIVQSRRFGNLTGDDVCCQIQGNGHRVSRQHQRCYTGPRAVQEPLS